MKRAHIRPLSEAHFCPWLVWLGASSQCWEKQEFSRALEKEDCALVGTGFVGCGEAGVQCAQEGTSASWTFVRQRRPVSCLTHNPRFCPSAEGVVWALLSVRPGRRTEAVGDAGLESKREDAREEREGSSSV